MGGVSYDTYLDGWNVHVTWSSDNTDYTWNAKAESASASPKYVVRYRTENAKRDYEKGELKFTIPGIGNVNRESLLMANTLNLKSDDFEGLNDWKYSWDDKNDLYTFTNNFEVKKGESVSGGFEFLYRLSAPNCVNGFHMEASPQFEVKDAGTITLEPMSFSFTATKEKHNLSLELLTLNRSEYEDSNAHYIWYDVKPYLNSSDGVIGLNSAKYLYEITVPDGITMDDVRLQDVQANMNGNTISFQTDNLSKVRVGFNKETMDGLTISIHCHVDRLFEDDTEWTTTADEGETVDVSREFVLKNYGFSYSGRTYYTEKTDDYDLGYIINGHYKTERLNVINIYNGSIVQFNIAVRKLPDQEEQLKRRHPTFPLILMMQNLLKYLKRQRTCLVGITFIGWKMVLKVKRMISLRMV